MLYFPSGASKTKTKREVPASYLHSRKKNRRRRKIPAGGRSGDRGEKWDGNGLSRRKYRYQRDQRRSYFYDTVVRRFPSRKRNSSVIVPEIRVNKYFCSGIRFPVPSVPLPSSPTPWPSASVFDEFDEGGPLFRESRFATCTSARFICSIKHRCSLEKRPDVFIVFVRSPCPLTVKDLSLSFSLSLFSTDQPLCRLRLSNPAPSNKTERFLFFLLLAPIEATLPPLFPCLIALLVSHEFFAPLPSSND